jgi:hypothetical protein
LIECDYCWRNVLFHDNTMQFGTVRTYFSFRIETMTTYSDVFYGTKRCDNTMRGTESSTRKAIGNQPERTSLPSTTVIAGRTTFAVIIIVTNSYNFIAPKDFLVELLEKEIDETPSEQLPKPQPINSIPLYSNLASCQYRRTPKYISWFMAAVSEFKANLNAALGSTSTSSSWSAPSAIEDKRIGNFQCL